MSRAILVNGDEVRAGNKFDAWKRDHTVYVGSSRVTDDDKLLFIRYATDPAQRRISFFTADEDGAQRKWGATIARRGGSTWYYKGRRGQAGPIRVVSAAEQARQEAKEKAERAER